MTIMTTTLQDVIEYVQGVVKGISGIRAAPLDPPGSLTIFPTSIAYPGPETWVTGDPAGMAKALRTIVMEIHICRKDMPRDYQAAMVFSDSIPLAFMADPTLGGKVSTFSRISSPGLVQLGWGTDMTIGFRFSIEGIKMQIGL